MAKKLTISVSDEVGYLVELVSKRAGSASGAFDQAMRLAFCLELEYRGFTPVEARNKLGMKFGDVERLEQFQDAVTEVVGESLKSANLAKHLADEANPKAAEERAEKAWASLPRSPGEKAAR